MSVKGFVVLTLVFRKEGRVWTGECLELGTATYGRSIEKGKQELVELVELDLNTLEDVGEREHFFKKHNVKFYTEHEPLPAPPYDEDAFVNYHRVPIEVAA